LVVAQSSSEIPEGLMNNPVITFLPSSGTNQRHQTQGGGQVAPHLRQQAVP
jgi:hypothetical protein